MIKNYIEREEKQLCSYHGGLKENAPHRFPSWQESLGRMRRCGVLGAGFGITKTSDIPSYISLLSAYS